MANIYHSSSASYLYLPPSMDRCSSSVRKASILFANQFGHLNNRVALASYVISNFEEGLIRMKKLLQILFGNKCLLKFRLNKLAKNASSFEAFFRQADGNLDDIIQLIKDDLTKLAEAEKEKNQEIVLLYQSIKEEEIKVEKLQDDLVNNEQKKYNVEKDIDAFRKELKILSEQIDSYTTGALSGLVFSILDLLPFSEGNSRVLSLESNKKALEKKNDEYGASLNSLKDIVHFLNSSVLQGQNSITSKQEEIKIQEESQKELSYTLTLQQEQYERILQMRLNLNKKVNSVSRIQVRTNAVLMESQEINDFNVIINTVLQLCREIEILTHDHGISNKIRQLIKQAKDMLESEYIFA